jgi:hypothetical protein
MVLSPGVVRGKALLLLLVFGVGAYLLGLSFFASGWEAGPNYRNVTVDTTVNITGSAPVIMNITVPAAQTLTAGTWTAVSCNVTVRDYNGFADIGTVNATIFHSTSTLFAADNNNTHYTNASCAGISGQENGYFKNYTCTFPVEYYALNGTWNCTAFVNDSINLRNNGSEMLTINGLYALNLSQPLIDYGDLAAGEYSENISVNISNYGNLPINISVLGYGNAPGDGLSFDCDQGNLSIDLQRFSANSSANYADKNTLDGTRQQIGNLTIVKAIDAAGSKNETYWQLYVDPFQPAYGICNGTIIFQAEAS